MAVILFILFGLAVGLLARALMPGKQPLGLAGTTALAVSGSFVGGIVGNLLAGQEITAFDAAGFWGSLLGAFFLLLLARGIVRSSRPTI